MVMQTDWFRTLLDYIGLNDIEIDNSPGKSLAPLLNRRPPDRLDLMPFSMSKKRCASIRTQRWAYFKYFPGSDKYKFEDELYDLAHLTPAKTRTLLPTRPMRPSSLN